MNGVSLSLSPGQIAGVVGESGCGKTTLGRAILGLQPITEGRIVCRGVSSGHLPPEQARKARPGIQHIHQDSCASLDPWWPIGKTLEETLATRAIARVDRPERVRQGLSAVGLDRSIVARHPHELSGGQLKRVVLARNLLLMPDVLILDEPTAGLDMSVQAMVFKLLLELRAELGLAYVFISHDLSVVERLSDHIAIMYLGKIVEIGPAAVVFRQPAHPYTQALLAAAPKLRKHAAPVTLQCDPPSAGALPRGCAFAARCPAVTTQCRVQDQHLRVLQERLSVACCQVGAL